MLNKQQKYHLHKLHAIQAAKKFDVLTSADVDYWNTYYGGTDDELLKSYGGWYFRKELYND